MNVEASVSEEIVSNKINLNFIINETEKIVLQKLIFLETTLLEKML